MCFEKLLKIKLSQQHGLVGKSIVLIPIAIRTVRIQILLASFFYLLANLVIRSEL